MIVLLYLALVLLLTQHLVLALVLALILVPSQTFVSSVCVWLGPTIARVRRVATPAADEHCIQR